MDSKEILEAFGIDGGFSLETMTGGHINTTYRVDAGREGMYVLQRINTDVFKDPYALMDNIFLVTSHLGRKRPSSTVLTFLETLDGRPLFPSSDGTFWRLSRYVDSAPPAPGAIPWSCRTMGEAYGTFISDLSDLDPACLCETIPHFHDTGRRVEHFMVTLGGGNGCMKERKAETDRDVDELMSLVEKALSFRRFHLPERVTHNDAKLSNILFDRAGRPVCVIDLDTVMPGRIAYDYGDAIRSAACPVPEDHTKAEEAVLLMEGAIALTRGFVEKTAGVMTEEEAGTLVAGAFSLVTEQTVRFYDDYISGDTYYRTVREKQNLDRARCQLNLAESILSSMPVLQAEVDGVYAKRHRQTE